ncbi:MAG: hypothetical protein E7632_06800 [Ruminococcaceae bacterium]|nr:hypothetical protein [Oscillospiraceae bacterium]
MTKRAISLILFAGILTSLAGCGSDASTDTTDAGTDAVETTAAPSEFTPVEADYGGKPFIIAENDVGDWMQSAFIEEQNGEVLNDSIYERNRIVEELYNVDIQGFLIQGGRNVQNLEQLTSGILAGDKDFDVAYIPGQLSSKIFNTPDYVVFLSDIPTLDLSHSWWDASSAESMTIKGQTISVTGDMIVSTTGSSTVTLFNKTLAEQFNLDIYGIVRDGKMTFDKMHSISVEVSADMNGDTEYNGDDDRFGLLLEGLNLPQMILAAGEHLVVNDGNTLKFGLETAKVAEVVEAYMDVVDDKNAVLSTTDKRFKTDDGSGETSCFNENRLMFWVTNLQRMQSARSYEAEFGLIPFPKYAESDEYVNPVNDYWCSWLIVPATNTELDRTGNVLDALGYYSQQKVTPAFIETAVTTKTLRDDESAEMLEMVLPNKIFDIGNYFDWGYWMLMNMASTHNRNIASQVAAQKSSIEKKINAYLEVFE